MHGVNMTNALARAKSVLMLTTSGGAETHRQRLTRQASASFAVKVASTGLVLVSGVLWARILGVDHYGAYAYAMSWTVMLTSCGLFGMDRLVLRQVAVYQEHENWTLAKGLLRWSHKWVAIVGICVAVLAIPACYLIVPEQGQMRAITLLAVLIVPVSALAMITAASLRGFGHVVTAEVPQLIVKPIIILVCIAVAWLALGSRVDSFTAVSIHLGAALASAAILVWILSKRRPQELRVHSCGTDHATWRKAALGFFLLTTLSVALEHLDVLMLGTLEGPGPAGVFAVAKRAAAFVAFPLLAVNAALAPTIARFHVQRDYERIQLAVRKSARRVAFVCLPIAAVLFIFGGLFLSVFGSDFVVGATAMRILIAGQVVNCMCGSVGIVLTMTNHEKYVIAGFALAICLKVILAILLIPHMGVAGQAIATALSMALWNVLLVIVAATKLKLWTVSIG